MENRFRISIRGPDIQNNFIANAETKIESTSLFKWKLETKLLNFDNEETFFKKINAKVNFCFVFFDYEYNQIHKHFN